MQLASLRASAAISRGSGYQQGREPGGCHGAKDGVEHMGQRTVVFRANPNSESSGQVASRLRAGGVDIVEEQANMILVDGAGEAISKALGATDVCLPSAGNAGSALAAYAAAGGLKAHVFLPRDIAKLFVMETEAYGAHVEMVDGLITDAGRVCAAKAREHGWYCLLYTSPSPRD